MGPTVAAAGNPTLVPLGIAMALFVLLLAGLGVAMVRAGGSRQQRRNRSNIERADVHRSLILNGLAAAIAVAAFVALAAHQLLLAACLAAIALAWQLVGRRAIKPH